jgi:hypothetical protein
LKTVWVLIVLVFADGEWREWKTFNRQEECLEVISTITYRRENTLIAVCRSKQITNE